MKRFLILCAALCFLLLTACEEKSDPNVYDVEYGGTVYTVNHNNRTISFNGHVCRYEVNGNSITLTYPDGSTYWWSTSGNIGYGGWSDDYDENRYVSGDTLWEVLEADRPGTKQNSNHGGLGILLVIFGIFEAVFPQASWWLSHGWRYKNAEPSELALGLGRMTGVIMVIAGIICFFV